MNKPGRPEDTNSINFLLKDRYVKLRLDLNGGNNWLSKLLEPEDMNAFADWKTPPEGKRVLIRNKENLPLKTIDNLIILYEVFGLKPANLKKILLGDKAGLDALRAEMSRRKTLVPFQVAMTQRGERVLDQLGTSGASLQDVDIKEVLFMSPTGAGEARFDSLSQLAVLRTLETALESERPSAVWEVIDGYIRLGELDAAEAMLDEYAPEKTAPEEESSEEGVARIHALLATEPKEQTQRHKPRCSGEIIWRSHSRQKNRPMMNSRMMR